MLKQIFVVALVLISTLAYAEKKSPTEKAKEKAEEMKKDLGLNADQYTKIYDINVKAYTSIAEYEAKKPSKKLKKKQKDIVQNMRNDQYKKILTAVQLKKYKDLKKQEKDEEKKLEKQLGSKK